MTNNFRTLLEEELLLLSDAVETLNVSYERCKDCIQKSTRTLEELERLEAFTGRFARATDILIQKVFRCIDEIELENEGSVLDRINRAEKRGTIKSAEKVIEMRRLRNRIAHEYLKESLEPTFSRTFVLTPDFLYDVELTRMYCQKLLVREKM